jgi:Flp pilus assembly protein TadG
MSVPCRSPLHRVRARIGSRTGQSAVEFILSIPLVLLVLAGIFDFGRHFYTRLTLRHAVAEAGRFAVTGAVLIDPNTGQPMTRANSIVQTILNNASSLNVQVSNLVIAPPNGGGPGQVVTITATYRDYFAMAPIVKYFGNGYVDFTVSTVMMNEPTF